MDAEKLQLVAIETPQGLHYDLWYPGYSWADTQGLWRPPGLSLPEHAGGFQALQCSELEQVIQKLNKLETGDCLWQLFPGLQFSRQNNPRGFPVIATTVTSFHNRGSGLTCEKILKAFQGLI